MKAIAIEKVVEFEDKIINHNWNAINNEVVLLLQHDDYKYLAKLTAYEVQDKHIFFEQELGNDTPQKINSDDSGEYVALFFHSAVFIYSWTDKRIVAKLKSNEIGKGNFEEGDFFDQQKIWTRFQNGSNIYLIIWDWKNKTTNWYSLRVNLCNTYYEEGSEFDCHQLIMHPSKNFFLGITDTYDGGYLDKVFYLPSFKDHTLQYIHPQAFDQDKTKTRFNHIFNQAGNKIAGIKVHYLEHHASYSYEVNVYNIKDFAKPIQSYSLQDQNNGLFDIQFMGNDNYLIIEGEVSFRIVDLKHQKIVFQNQDIDKVLSFGPNKSSFCTRKLNQLYFYKLSAKFYEEKKTTTELSSNYLNDFFNQTKTTIIHHTRCYTDLSFIPLLKVYFEFYAAVFDIRSKVQLHGDVLPEASMNVVNQWFEDKQADYLEQWKLKIAERKRYLLSTEFGDILFYPLQESEYKNSSPKLTLVYKDKVISISFFEYFSTNQLPPKVMVLVQQWLVDNYDKLTAPWKDKPYYANFKLIPMQEKKEAPSSKQNNTNKEPKSLLKKLLQFFKL